MPKTNATRPIFSITNPNKGWVVQELDKLREEWDGWLSFAEQLGVSSDYDPTNSAEGLMDGWDNRRKHAVLREKTLVFVGNNFSGYEFLFYDWPSHPHESGIDRISQVAPLWIHRLRVLSSSIEYARVPDGYWLSKGKYLVDEIVKSTPDKAAEVAASYLKNPMSD